MGGHFLQLRDQGWPGAWEIFFRARELRACAEPPCPGGTKTAVAFVCAPEFLAEAENWRESAALAGCEITDEVSRADIVVGEGLSGEELLTLADREQTPSVINGGNENASPCRVLGDLLALVRHFGHDADKLDGMRLSWIGNASGRFAGLAGSWLDSCLCFRHELFLSFPPGGEPGAEALDFAMNAGGKIFLSHDPALVVEGAHGLIAVPWHTGRASPSPRASPADDGAAGGSPQRTWRSASFFLPARYRSLRLGGRAPGLSHCLSGGGSGTYGRSAQT